MSKPATLAQWVRYLSDEEMPVLATTARRIAGISGEHDTSVAELAQVVLADSAMTTKVLRMANSVYYNPAGSAISTVSRAIVMLGFDAVRAIALSIAMVDTLLRGRRHERVTEEMARSFHAAVQAKALAECRGDTAPEEVFIATLLYRLGYMAFWCFPQGYEEEMEKQLDGAQEEAPVERKVLGFTLGELTAALNREWHLSDLLAQAIEGKGTDPRTGDIHLGVELAKTVQEGWDAPEVAHVVARIAEFTRYPQDDTLKRLHECARRAATTASEYGAEMASHLIPLPGRAPSGRAAAGPAQPAPDGFNAQLQLRILRELSAMLSERVDLNALLGTVLEGIYRGVGMDRAVLALVTPDGSRLKAKYTLGSGRERLRECFNFPVGGEAPHILAQVLIGTEPLWLSATGRYWRQYLTPAITGCLGENDFFAFPLGFGGRARGVIYADRATSGRRLDGDSFDAFCHLGEQAIIGLSVSGVRN